jgi:guanylate kinase
MGRNGTIFVMSAPSGAGKSTLCRAMMERWPQLVYSVSHTSRSPRPGERDGKDYHFVSKAAFRQKIDAGLMAEWAQVHGNYYGTAVETLEQALSAGQGILLDIDVQGMRQLLEKFPGAVTIFILPPSMEELKKRLTKRGTETAEVIARRLDHAEREIASRHAYQHVIVNDSLAEATAALAAVFEDHLT